MLAVLRVHDDFACNNSLQIESSFVHINRSQAFKTVFLGNSNVGKTCLAKLIVDRKIADQTTNTIGFDHHTKSLELEEGIPVNVCKLELLQNMLW